MVKVRLMSVVNRLRGLRQARRRAPDLPEGMEFPLEARARQPVAEGLPAAEARRAARAWR